MLTTVANDAQPTLPCELLTLVYMVTTLKDRLEAAIAGKDIQQTDLIAAVRQVDKKISRAAVSKWFRGETKELRAAHVFAVARRCEVDPEWLATGNGAMKRGAKSSTPVPADIPAHRIALIKLYSTLPAEDRAAARRFIETMAWQHHPRKDEYVKGLRNKPLAVHDE
jgi:hypothetical protein